jgi:NADH:ubiquinone oxidoreductase subunit D
MEFYERVSGARMHSNFIRPGGVYAEFDSSLLDDIVLFTLSFRTTLAHIFDILTYSRI